MNATSKSLEMDTDIILIEHCLKFIYNNLDYHFDIQWIRPVHQRCQNQRVTYESSEVYNENAEALYKQLCYGTKRSLEFINSFAVPL